MVFVMFRTSMAFTNARNSVKLGWVKKNSFGINQYMFLFLKKQPEQGRQKIYPLLDVLFVNNLNYNNLDVLFINICVII